MAWIAPLVGFFVAPVAAGLVYVDGARRGRSQLERVLWAVGAGVVSFGGFLLPALSEGALGRAYLLWFKSAPVVTSPLEILALHVTVGLAVSAVTLLLYGFASRYGPLETG